MDTEYGIQYTVYTGLIPLTSEIKPIAWSASCLITYYDHLVTHPSKRKQPETKWLLTSADR